MKVVHVVNAVGPTSGPATHAAALNRLPGVDASVVAWFKAKSCAHDVDIRCLGAPDTAIGVDRSTIRQLRSALRGADVVHTHHPHSAAVTKLVAASMGVPTVFTSGTDHSQFSRVGRLANALTSPFSAAVTAVSDSAAATHSRWERRLMRGVPRVIETGIDIDRLDRAMAADWPLDPALLDDDTFLIGSAGRLSAPKDYETLIAAAIEADRQLDRPVRCVIMGEGGRRGALEETIERLDGRGVVTLAGERSREEVYAALPHFDLFSMPSRWEGLCSAVQEAMAAGVACVLSDIPAFDPFEPLARLHPVGDAPALAAAIVELADHPDRRSRLAERGRSYARARFGLDQTAQAYVALYQDVLSGEREEGVASDVEVPTPGIGMTDGGVDQDPVI